MQTIFMDLAIGDVYEASADLSKNMKIDCASKISMRDGLIAILCEYKHKLSILMITEEQTLQEVATEQFYDEFAEASTITYSDVMLIRNSRKSKNAFLVYI